MRYNWMRRILHADQRQKQNHKEREPADSSSGIIPMNRRTWIDIETGKHFLSACEVSKKIIHLLRHSQQVHRERMGRFISGKSKKIFKVNSHKLLIGLTIDGKHAWQQEEEQKDDSSIALMIHE